MLTETLYNQLQCKVPTERFDLTLNFHVKATPGSILDSDKTHPVFWVNFPSEGGFFKILYQLRQAVPKHGQLAGLE